VNLMTSILKILVLILWMSHMGTCLWFGLSMNPELEPDTGKSWQMTMAQYYGADDITDISSATSVSDGYLYVTGFYWSVTAMFSGASITKPENSFEAWFALAYVIFGMLFGSSLISSLAAMLIDFQMVARDANDQIRSVRLFLSQNKIHPLLCLAIQNQVVDRMSVEERLSETDVPVLARLSADLRRRLRLSCRGPFVYQNSPLFRICESLDPEFVRALCTSGVNHLAAYPGEELFTPGTMMEHAYLLKWGQVQYTHRPDDTFTRNLGSGSNLSLGVLEFVPEHGPALNACDHVDPGSWLCELTIWSYWTSLGLLRP